MKTVYCKCLNKYILEDKCNCDKVPCYWKQGIGKTEAVRDE